MCRRTLYSVEYDTPTCVCVSGQGFTLEPLLRFRSNLFKSKHFEQFKTRCELDGFILQGQESYWNKKKYKSHVKNKMSACKETALDAECCKC